MAKAPDHHLLFLYTRLADYFYQSIRALLVRHPDISATVITHRPDENAPYHFAETQQLSIRMYEAFPDEAAMLTFVKKLQPTAIYVAGWTNQRYLNLAKGYRAQVPIILGIDNPWRGTLRQRLGCLLYGRSLRRQFTHIWCPGAPQLEFARRLGFVRAQRLPHLYVANTMRFHDAYLAQEAIRRRRYPHRLLYLGRYVAYKQPLVLVQQFAQLVAAGKNNGWSLELIGAGPLWEELKQYENEYILVKDFLAPEDLPEQLAGYGAFCLPSQNEHWGVVVQEAAAAGLPLLLSDTVHAGTTFLIDQQNGWQFKSSAPDALREALLQLVNTPDEQLLQMGNNSYDLSRKVSHLDWEISLLSVLPNPPGQLPEHSAQS